MAAYVVEGGTFFSHVFEVVLDPSSCFFSLWHDVVNCSSNGSRCLGCVGCSSLFFAGLRCLGDSSSIKLIISCRLTIVVVCVKLLRSFLFALKCLSSLEVVVDCVCLVYVDSSSFEGWTGLGC